MGIAADNLDDLVQEIKSLPAAKRAEVVAFVRAIRGGTDDNGRTWHDASWADTVSRLDDLEGVDAAARDAWFEAMRNAATPAHYEPGEGIILDG